MKAFSAFLVMLLATSYLLAQTTTIKNVELAGDKIIVHYDLEDANPNNEYKLQLYTSKDNFVTPVTKVTGDVGGEVAPGANKKMVWSVLEELGGYKGRLALEIRGNVYSPFVKLREFNFERVYKRGKSYSLAWKPGASNPINIELYKGGERISGEMNQPNNGGHTFFIPAQSKKGNDYRLKISDTRNPSDILYTPNFKVRQKIPMVLKAGSVLAIGGIILMLAPEGGKGPGTSSDSEIPGVPPLPGN